MKKGSIKSVRGVIYTRVSTDHGLEQAFNSLDAQHDAAQAYIRSQAHTGWMLIRSRYADVRSRRCSPFRGISSATRFRMR